MLTEWDEKVGHFIPRFFRIQARSGGGSVCQGDFSRCIASTIRRNVQSALMLRETSSPWLYLLRSLDECALEEEKRGDVDGPSGSTLSNVSAKSYDSFSSRRVHNPDLLAYIQLKMSSSAKPIYPLSTSEV